MPDATQSKMQTAMASRVAAEDIQPHDIVAVLNQVYELPSFLWSCLDSLTPMDNPVRLRFMPSDPGKPFKVTDVCLPFVYARNTSSKQVIFDIRRHQLVRLESHIGRKVWKRMRRAFKQTQLPKN